MSFLNLIDKKLQPMCLFMYSTLNIMYENYKKVTNLVFNFKHKELCNFPEIM